MKFMLTASGNIFYRAGHNRWRTLLVAWLMLLPMFSLGLYTSPTASAALALDPNMETTWKRTDQFVAQGSQPRSWLWGPQAFSIVTEDYDGSPGSGDVPAGKRLVAYFDKSRMEINNPMGDRSSKYFVTNGLLVKELIGGRRQFGDTNFASYVPSDTPVVGDRFNNSKAPTYYSLGEVSSLVLGQNSAKNRLNQSVTAYIERDGGIREDLTYGKYNVSIAYYDPTFGHNVPGVFWDFMNSRGKVLENGQTVDGPVVDWIFSTGYALTEPFWTKAVVAGKEKDVLMQCFERRCYSYTPSNPAAFQVEMGNVGQHYYNWRYRAPVLNCSTAPIRGFGKLWADNPSVKARIGCPYSYSAEQVTKIAVLNFEHGKMVWVNSSAGTSYYLPFAKTIFAVFDDGSWATVADSWDESQPESANLVAPPGLYEPKRGFGKAWRNETGLKLRERLGWAIEKYELGGVGAVQNFWSGLMLWFGPTKEIFVGFRYYNRTNVWETYPDTFVG